MSMWISVYCQKPIEKFRSSTLDRLIKRQMPDWAEYFPVVKVTEYRRAGEESLFHLNYRVNKDKLHKNSPPASVARVRGGAPIVIDIVSDPDDVADAIRRAATARKRREEVEVAEPAVISIDRPSHAVAEAFAALSGELKLLRQEMQAMRQALVAVEEALIEHARNEAALTVQRGYPLAFRLQNPRS
ncbi:MAG: hypothetical protein WCG92_20895 [Hyphomicrobiales bacterium]